MPFVSHSGRILAALTVLLALGGHAFGAKVSFDFFDGTDFLREDRGFVRFFIDVLDDSFKVVPKEGISEVQLFVDDQLVEGEWSLDTVREANEPVAIALLVAAHSSYAYVAQGTPNVLEASKRGYKGFLGNLTDQDWVTVWFYNEEGIKRVISWGQNMNAAADQIDRIRPGEKADGGTPPALYNAIKRVVEDVNENAPTLPRRRIVVVLSDGKDRSLESTATIERRIKEIEDIAKTAGDAKVYALGFTLDVPDPLVHLNTLAQRTNAVYRYLADVESEDGLVMEIENFAREIKNQYVLRFKPKDYSGNKAPVTVRLEMKTNAGPGTRIIPGVMWPEKPFSIVPILIIVGIVLGSLLGIFLLIKLFKAIARRRANRPVYVEQEEEFSGPYKGKLTCTEGSYAGSEFFLTEDVTTIGSIAGNAIVLQAKGVSKRHAGIKIEDMRFELADFGSSNGTFVNGNKVTKQFLRDQDKIRIGECELKFTLK